MANKIILRNLTDAPIDLPTVYKTADAKQKKTNGVKILLGCTSDHGVVGVVQPEQEIEPWVWAKLKALRAVQNMVARRQIESITGLA